jgi:uncharacterized protein (TIGR04255 family)
MSKKYKNSPLTEVVAEFNFIPSTAWNATIPGLMYESVKREFPEIKQRPGIVRMRNPLNRTDQPELETIELVQFWNKQGNLLIQTGKDILTVNALKPYPTWEKFFPNITEGLNQYVKVAKPKGLTRASLRYINSIEVNSKNFLIENNFEFELPKAKNLKKEIAHFNAHIEYNLDERDVFAKILQNVVSNKPNTKGIIFQLEVVMNKVNGLAIKDSSAWLQKSHDVIVETFEASLNETLKKAYE